MIYLTQMLGKPVLDSAGEQVGAISDIGISTAEVFPRVTALAFKGPDKTPFMLSWRKFVAEYDGEAVRLAAPTSELRFSYLQPDEILLSRDLLNKQIVDTQGMRVVRVNDLKLSESRNQLRLLGAEVGARGLLRALHPAVERGAQGLAKLFGGEIPEHLIAWSYMDLVESDLSQVKLSVTHKRLNELHPADVADILEQLAPAQRATVFAHLDQERAAEAVVELEDEFQADFIDDLSERQASDLLAEMDPDDAADILNELGYEKTERLLRLMGIGDADSIRKLLGYREKSAGGLMTPEVLTATEDMTVRDVMNHIREVAEERETINYVYAIDDQHHLMGVVSLRRLLLSPYDTTVSEILERELFTVTPEEDQEEVAAMIARYDLLAIPVVNEENVLLGIVTVDDALDVLEEEAEEDLARATGVSGRHVDGSIMHWVFPRRSGWLVVWLLAVFAASALRVGANGARDQLFAIGDGSVGFWILVSAELLVVGATLLPLLLITLEGAVLRGYDELIDVPADERPTTPRRAAIATGIGLAVGLLYGVVAFAFVELLTSGEQFALSIGFGISLVVAAVLSALVGLALVGRAVRRADGGREVRVDTSAGVLMVVSSLLVAVAAFATVYLTMAVTSGAPALLG